ncbi:RNA polymerase Rpb3/Rpb11 dimerization domain protein [Dictyocaulus viviparus]|uniref:RNA polymerase Rpb3/Rpb11 dimerization domain protein n=1 Tax=Dictyocaulus viviparus TaxID=29172 RepID=A0A0D8Y9K3_DICVI|nr:RNA polymerase Rpb3/Rpb11 dimerization domain protein [Dictyocaulus viviparus]
MGAKRSSKIKNETNNPVTSKNEIKLEEERVLNIVFVNEADNGMSLDFDLINVEAPIANTLRRILLAEVPSMAIEKVYLYQNTSVIQVIGVNEHGVDCEEEPKPDSSRTVVFNINVTCTRNRDAPSTATEPHNLYHQSSVYSKSFKWVPCGDQLCSDDKVAVVADARRDTCSRNVFRHSDLSSVVELGRKKNHFIFNVESTGALKSAELVIEACKISKPIADAVIRYGKDHPLFRNKILIPIGKEVESGLVRMTTSLRMKRLGLGESSKTAAVSEAAALEQASDLVQQLVLFTYSLVVFFGYYYYTKKNTPENLKLTDFEEFCEKNEKRSDSDKSKNDSKRETATEKKSRSTRVSSLPIDAASCIVLEGEYITQEINNHIVQTIFLCKLIIFIFYLFTLVLLWFLYCIVVIGKSMVFSRKKLQAPFLSHCALLSLSRLLLPRWYIIYTNVQVMLRIAQYGHDF